jgi:hypothetical protein
MTKEMYNNIKSKGKEVEKPEGEEVVQEASSEDEDNSHGGVSLGRWSVQEASYEEMLSDGAGLYKGKVGKYEERKSQGEDVMMEEVFSSSDEDDGGGVVLQEEERGERFSEDDGGVQRSGGVLFDGRGASSGRPRTLSRKEKNALNHMKRSKLIVNQLRKIGVTDKEMSKTDMLTAVINGKGHLTKEVKSKLGKVIFDPNEPWGRRAAILRDNYGRAVNVQSKFGK